MSAGERAGLRGRDDGGREVFDAARNRRREGSARGRVGRRRIALRIAAIVPVLDSNARVILGGGIGLQRRTCCASRWSGSCARCRRSGPRIDGLVAGRGCRADGGGVALALEAAQDQSVLPSGRGPKGCGMSRSDECGHARRNDMRRLLMVVAVAALVAPCVFVRQHPPRTPAVGGAIADPGACTTKGSRRGSRERRLERRAAGDDQLWSFYSGGEFKKYCEVLQDFHQLYPWISIQHTGGSRTRTSSGRSTPDTAPDMADHLGPRQRREVLLEQHVHGTWPRISRSDNIDLASIGPDAALAATPATTGTSARCRSFRTRTASTTTGTCSRRPASRTAPKTLSELKTDAKKLTVLNPDGSIEVAGYVPLQSFYESTQLYNGDYSGGDVVRPERQLRVRLRPELGEAPRNGRRRSSRTCTAPTGTTSCRSSSPSSAAPTPSGRAPTASRPRAGRHDDGRRMAQRVHRR